MCGMKMVSILPFYMHSVPDDLADPQFGANIGSFPKRQRVFAAAQENKGLLAPCGVPSTQQTNTMIVDFRI